MTYYIKLINILSFILINMRFNLIYAFIFNNRFIKNDEYPICINCKHYKKDIKFPNDSLLAKCTLFGEKNILNGEIKNYYVDLVRNNNNQCGLYGRYYADASTVNNSTLLINN